MGKRCIGEQERRKKERNGREEVEEERVGRWFSCVLENCLPHMHTRERQKVRRKRGCNSFLNHFLNFLFYKFISQ